MYGTKDFNPKLSFEEFDSKVKFTYGVPLIVLDIVDQLTGSTFLSDHYKQVFPKKLIERFDPHCDQFLDSKGQIDEEFLPMTWALFNALGEVDFNTEQGNFMQEDRELRQFISLASLKKNLSKVLGIRNDFFAFLLFNYLSNHAPQSSIVDYN